MYSNALMRREIYKRKGKHRICSTNSSRFQRLNKKDRNGNLKLTL